MHLVLLFDQRFAIHVAIGELRNQFIEVRRTRDAVISHHMSVKPGMDENIANTCMYIHRLMHTYSFYLCIGTTPCESTN